MKEEEFASRQLNISMVVAMGKNRAIGNNNQLLWHLPNDLKHFKSLTIGKPVIMGRKTFESIGKPLPRRDNLILTTSDLNDFSHPITENVKLFAGINQLLEFLGNNYQQIEIMVIGGGEIYRRFLPYTKKIYLTLVDAELPAEVFFPDLDTKLWQECVQQRVDCNKDDQHAYNYSFLEFLRK